MSTEDTEPQNGGQVVPFAAVLQQIRQGDFHSLLSTDLQDLTRRVMATGKKGSMTVTLTVAPMKGAADNYQVSASHAVKAPKDDAMVSIFFATDEGNLTRDDPRQLRLPLRDVNTSKGATA